MSVITLEVRDPSGALNSTLTRYLDPWVEGARHGAFDRNWQGQLSETGIGHLTLNRNDPDGANVHYDDRILCFLDGVHYFTWIATERDENPIDADEEAGEVVTWGGQGRASILSYASVYPEFGVGRRTPDIRQFDFSADAFDDSGWGLATPIQTSQSTDGPWPGWPEGWPDPAAKWIWTEQSPAAVGDVYMRGRVTIVRTGRYAIFATADDGFELYIDGARVMGERTPYMWGTTRRTDVDLDAGEHVFAIHAVNEAGPAGVILTGLETTNGGRDLGPVAIRTNETWLVQGYPAVVPGMTPGRIMRVLVTEGLARGCWGAADGGPPILGFTDTLDSAGNAWSSTINPGVQVGTSVLDALRQISELGFEWKMDPDSPTLRLYNELGADVDTVLARGINIEALRRKGSVAERASVFLARYRGRGVDQQGWMEVADPGGAASTKRREQFLSAGQQDWTYITKLAEALFEVAPDPRNAITVATLNPYDAAGDDLARGYIDYGIGDWVHAPDENGDSTRYRVHAITVGENTEGVAHTTPELAGLTQEFADRLQRWLKRMVPGSLEGSSENVSPPEVLPPFESLVDIPPALDDLVDVAPIDPGPGDVLIYDPDLGQWAPTNLPELIEAAVDEAIGAGGFGASSGPAWSQDGAVAVGVSGRFPFSEPTSITKVRFMLDVAGTAIGSNPPTQVSFLKNGVAFKSLSLGSGGYDTGWVSLNAPVDFNNATDYLKFSITSVSPAAMRLTAFAA